MVFKYFSKNLSKMVQTQNLPVIDGSLLVEGKQAGAELGQAQLKLGLDLTSTSLH